MKTGWGIGKREIEREREEQIKRVGKKRNFCGLGKVIVGNDT